MKWKTYKYFYRTFEVNEKGQIRNERGMILKGTMHPNGFRTINLHLIGERDVKINKSLLIHRMVAECWVENPELKPYVIHKDGNLLNNRAKNLEWATPNEKIAHQQHLGKHGNTKLSTKEVLQIKRLLSKNEQTINDIARSYNISHTQIHRIKKGENWQ
jgi:hypothetical protein